MTALPPGSWIGVFGGGQLGRMLALEARRMGYRVRVLDPDPRGPAAQVADDALTAPYDDADAARALARSCGVLTYEFENVDPEAVAAAESITPCFPSSRVLAVTRHRLREREAVARLGLPVPRFAAVHAPRDLDGALARVGLPAVLKTATGGYDGKGQARVRDASGAREAAAALLAAGGPLVAEEWVDIAVEISVVAARARDGRVACFPVAENHHAGGILDVTVVPARVPEAVAARAREMAVALAVGLDVVGLLAVEMFLARDGRLLVNELAPRPHNSGHYTLDACATSQFEQLVRVLCGLPLGATDLLAPVAMANLLGDVWLERGGEPDWAAALAVPGVRLHLYGKAEARRGRKMGHLTAVAATPEEALARVRAAREAAAASPAR